MFLCSSSHSLSVGYMRFATAAGKRPDKCTCAPASLAASERHSGPARQCRKASSRAGWQATSGSQRLGCWVLKCFRKWNKSVTCVACCCWALAARLLAVFLRWIFCRPKLWARLLSYCCCCCCYFSYTFQFQRKMPAWLLYCYFRRYFLHAVASPLCRFYCSFPKFCFTFILQFVCAFFIRNYAAHAPPAPRQTTAL